MQLKNNFQYYMKYEMITLVLCTYHLSYISYRERGMIYRPPAFNVFVREREINVRGM